jgi:hypothetical protein
VERQYLGFCQCNDIQHKDTLQNGIQHKDTLHNGIQNKGTLHIDIQHDDSQLSFVHAEHHFNECHFAEGQFPEFCYSNFICAKCHHVLFAGMQSVSLPNVQVPDSLWKGKIWSFVSDTTFIIKTLCILTFSMMTLS